MFEGLLQPMHLLLIGIIAMVVLGPKRLPELGRGLGEGIRNFRDSMKNLSEDRVSEPVKTLTAGDTTPPSSTRHPTDSSVA